MQISRALYKQNTAFATLIGMLASMMVFFLCATAQGAPREMTDQEIADAVEREMATDPMVPAVNIDVDAGNGALSSPAK